MNSRGSAGRRKLNLYLKGAAWFCAVVGFLIVAIVTSFSFTSWVYQASGFTPAPLVVQVVNSLSGLFLFGVTIALIGRLFRSKIEARQNQFWKPIFEALSRMAQGDFSVRVDDITDDDSRDGGVLSELVSSVNRTAQELRQMENLRQEFISNVSHEIQSPLTSIRGFARAMQTDGLSPEDQAHYLSIIETESTRLSRITENLLKLASLESEHVRFEPKLYRLDHQIRDLILACEPQWSGKKLEMEVALAEVEITADEDLLSQVWNNLLHNSIKFTPEGGKLCVGLLVRGPCVEVRVSDTGVGIALEDQARVFERFYKVDKARTRATNAGSGLGLSIASKIVEMHKGSIALESQPGTGSTFTVSLPLQPESVQRPV